jgi:hypothetical protein
MITHVTDNVRKQRATFVFLFLLSFVLVIDFPVADTFILFSVKHAEARLGRPASPNSVAGVHRRTRRRTARRVTTGRRVRTLPAGCKTVTMRGVKYHNCGGVYYRPFYEGDRVVYVVENP